MSEQGAAKPEKKDPVGLTAEEQRIWDSVMKDSLKSQEYDKLDSVEKAKLGNWNSQRTLDEIYEKFLLAVQQRTPSAIGDHVWTFDDTFDKWLQESRLVLEGRKLELKEKFEQKIAIYPKLVKRLESGELTNAPKDVGRTLTREDYEFYQLVIRKTIEVIDLAIKGVLKPTSNPHDIKEMDPDSDLDAMLELDKKPKKIIIP